MVKKLSPQIQTGIMLTALGLGILTFIKPTSTESIWKYLGLSAINFTIITLLIFVIYVMITKPKWFKDLLKNIKK